MADVVVVTGGSAGIGRAVARQFARRGDAVALIARGAERLEQARAELEVLGVPVHTVQADVADAAAIEAAAEAIEAALGPITIWVNNAMVTVYGEVSTLQADEVRRVTDVVYHGAVNGTMTAMRRMKRGTIVQVSSVLAWRAIPVQAPYCAAKFALRGFTESLRSELIRARSPLHLTMVHLPAVNTPQFGWARNKTGQEAKAPGPYDPEVAAEAIVFAATHRRREMFVGSATPPTILAARLAPGVLDQVLSRKGYSATLGAAQPDAGPGNLFEPAPGGGQAAEGSFGAESKGRRDIYSSRQADAVAVGTVLFGVAGLGALALSPLMLGPALLAGAAMGPLRAVVRRQVMRR